MAYLVADGRLEIKFAFTPNDIGMFHEKVGIIKDNLGNEVCFYGSNNETAHGWIYNIESFNVYRSWQVGEKAYLDHSKNRFENLWNSSVEGVRVVSAPTAFTDKLVEIRPDKTEVVGLVKQIEKYEEKKREVSDIRKLRPYQEDAIKSWIENGNNGIFEMATGSGKTLTAIETAKLIFKNKQKLLCVVAVPQTHLANQWVIELNKQAPELHTLGVDTKNSAWKEELKTNVLNYSHGLINNLVVVITYSSLRAEFFIDLLKSIEDSMIIADEVHNMGSPENMKSMLPSIRYRLGLSATPERLWDEDGTQEIEEYFKGTVATYTLGDAIRDGYLTKYHYHPQFVYLDDDEFGEYVDISKSIYVSQDDNGQIVMNERVKRLLIQRAQIIKRAQSKFTAYEDLVIGFGSNAHHVLVYCDSTKQMVAAQKILNSNGQVNHQFTENESPKARSSILRSFAEGLYPYLVAIKCLDEGVDVPETETAIILASSSNPREYIQRRGRVLRKTDDKEHARIYDFIVLPPTLSPFDEALKVLEKKLISNEFKRVGEFLKYADNKLDILNTMYPIMEKYNIYTE